MNWPMVWLGTGIAAVLAVVEQLVRGLYLRRLTRRDRTAWRRFYP